MTIIIVATVKVITQCDRNRHECGAERGALLTVKGGVGGGEEKEGEEK